MKQSHRKQLGISLKLLLFVGLFFNLNFEVKAKRNLVSQEMHNANGLNLNDRMSKIEAENEQHKTEISLLKTVVEEDKKAIAILTIKVEEEHEAVNHLKSHIERLENTAFNYSTTKKSSGNPTSGKTRNKREVGNKAPAKLTKNKCAESSNLCTFYYPDHPDALSARNSTISQNKKFSNSDSYSNGSKSIMNLCSESSRFCTFAHPDHPGALSAIKSNSYSPVFNPVYNLNEGKSIVSGNQNTIIENDNNTSGARFYGPPTNCSDLVKLGHTLNGYYLVKGSDKSTKNRITTVYCAFHQAKGVLGKQGIQTQIGAVELKAKSVYFFVAMTENLESGYLLFKRMDVNVGGAMSEWKFTAPVAGIYHFQFSAIVHNLGTNFTIAIGVGSDFHQYTKIDCQNCSTQFVSLVRTCHLNAKDKVWLYKPPGTSGTIAGGGSYDSHSNFAGWLVEEDVVLA